MSSSKLSPAAASHSSFGFSSSVETGVVPSLSFSVSFSLPKTLLTHFSTSTSFSDFCFSWSETTSGASYLVDVSFGLNDGNSVALAGDLALLAFFGDSSLTISCETGFCSTTLTSFFCFSSSRSFSKLAFSFFGFGFGSYFNP
ncbi:hypothetical protein TVAG_381240 [Trichomonas vaginalis G3]|uniref:Uncharacterized protein n=1 Tax=Trichomonas vaginalis (strain ATCC PRA-98 / G3) TaxID=412133 RepID=A2GZV4_TRIV3|nr:hypothetical protein TVAG_381240 [Trichomonas vaginalis G3]|eukprot:XP_001290243.1 hypothetical protein [Trichomonas vaginalis G3]